MNLYRLEAWPEGLQFLNPRGYAVGQALAQFGTPRPRHEELPAVDLVTRNLGKDLAPTDFPWLASNVPVYSEKAMSRLEETLIRHGEIVPLDSDQGTFVALDVQVWLPVVDIERCEVRRYPSGRVMVIEKYAFLSEAIGEWAIFGDAAEDGAGDVFVLQEYVDEVERTGLTGGSFNSSGASEPGGRVNGRSGL